ncbi:hypothetical protein DFH11DRAFT_1820838 [Phellopilus nigrolimitatus]|nr:hypothetical protein DFH11DRAFT_1820838 [Phellopilus nigrolimitatus]
MSTVTAISVLNEFVRERCVVDEAGKCTPIAFLLTPVGASAPFYCLPASWSTPPISDHGPLTAAGIVSRLYRTTMSFNASLMASLKATHPNDRSLARASVTAAGCTEWYHGILQAMLFDKVDWALRSCHTPSPILRIAHSSYTQPSAIPKQAERMWEIYRNWTDTTSAFVTAWVASESEGMETEPAYITEENASQLAIGPAGNDGQLVISRLMDNNTLSTTDSDTESSRHGMRGVVESLVRGTEQTSAAAHVNLVENNFCWAALGLLAISLRASDEGRHMPSSDTPGTVSPTLNNGAMGHATSGNGSGAMPKKRLTDYLAISENCGHLPREIAGLADYDLLRPLYALAGISPIVLLSKLQITATGKCKVGLSHLAELITHPTLNDDRSRRYIERDLFKVLIQMVLKGHSYFKISMGPVIEKWREDGVLTPSNQVSCDDKAVIEVDLAESFRHAQETQPIGFRTIRNLTKLVEGIGKRSRAKSHEIIDILALVKVSLTDENPPWLASALASEGAKKTSPLSGHDTNTESLEDGETRRSNREKKGVERGLGGEPGKLTRNRNRKRTKKPEVASDEEGEMSDRSQLTSEKDGSEDWLVGRGKNKRGSEDDIEMNDETSKPKKRRHIDDSDDENDESNKNISFSGRRPQYDLVDFSKPPPAAVEFCPIHIYSVLRSLESFASITLEDSPSDPIASKDPPSDPIASKDPPSDPIAPEDPPSDPIASKDPPSDPLAPEDSSSDPKKDESAGYRTRTVSPFGSELTPLNSQTQSPDLSKADADVGVHSEESIQHEKSQTQSPDLSKADAGVGVHSEEPIQHEKSPRDSEDFDLNALHYDYSLRATINVPIWPSMRKGFIERTMLLRDSKGKPNQTISILREDWERLDFARRRDIFKTRNVHISGPPRTPLFEIKDWSSPGFDGLLDLAQPRQVHDMTVPIVNDANANIRFARLDAMLQYIYNMEDEKRLAETPGATSKLGAQCLNALDIPLPGFGFFTEVLREVFSEFDDCSKFIFQDTFNWFTELGPTSLGSHWGLLALQSARSETHMDAGGGCSIIHMVLGSKEWLIATNPDMLPGPRGWIPNESDWEAVYLQPGDDLIMHPGTIHSVITLEDCFAVGGHFYFTGLFGQTLRAMVIEHYHGKWITNTEHTRMPLLLLKALVGFADIYLSNIRRQTLADRFPDMAQLSYLLVIVRHLDQLGPELPEDPNEKSWTDSLQFKADFARTLIVVRTFVVDLMAFPGAYFQTEMQSAEDDLASLVDLLNQMNGNMEKTEKKKHITCICMCGLPHKRSCHFKVDGVISRILERHRQQTQQKGDERGRPE